MAPRRDQKARGETQGGGGAVNATHIQRLFSERYDEPYIKRATPDELATRITRDAAGALTHLVKDALLHDMVPVELIVRWAACTEDGTPTAPEMTWDRRVVTIVTARRKGEF